MSFFLLAQVVLSLQFAHIRRFEVRKKLHLGLRRWLLNYSPSDAFEVQEIRKNWDSIQYKVGSRMSAIRERAAHYYRIIIIRIIMEL